MITGGVIITADNRGPIINVISWILIVLTALATLAKVWSKWSLTKKLQADDYYMAAATVTAAGWVAAVSMQVNAGLGRHLATMSPEEVSRYEQAAYSSQLLYIVSLGFAKMAILHFLLSLARAEARRMAVNGTMVFNAISMLVGIFAVAFQCSLPQPWALLSAQCFDQTSFWITFGVLDILVDVASAILPFLLLHDLRTKWQRKLPAIIAFGLRFLLVPMIILRLVYLKLNAGSTDRPFNDFSIAIATSVHVTFSVIFTCLPFLKTVMDNIQTGLLAGDVRIGYTTQHYGYRLGKSANHTANSLMVQAPRRTHQSRANGYISKLSNDAYVKGREHGYSRVPNERMVINQTTTISLKSDRIYGPFEDAP